MKSVLVAMAFSAVLSLTALAQTTPPMSQPSGTNPSTVHQQPPPDMNPSGGGQAADTKAEAKDNKKIKGCLQNAGGKYMIQDKHGKQIALGGSQDFSSHVGHTVVAHGTFANGSDSSSGGTAMSTSGAPSADQFMVTKLDMISESCTGEKGKPAKDNDHDLGKPTPNRK